MSLRLSVLTSSAVALYTYTLPSPAGSYYILAVARHTSAYGVDSYHRPFYTAVVSSGIQ